MLIDTSGWFCIFDSNEVDHELARSIYHAADRRLTHSYILAELVALSDARKRNRSELLFFLDNLLSDSKIELIWVDEILTLRAVKLLSERDDKIWSLCDAVSFVLMSDENIHEALTTDSDFEQAGFIRLLRQ